MSHPMHQRPLEPLVERNPFRQMSNTDQPIPFFATDKGELPEPVLPAFPAWVELYWRAWEMAWSHICKPGATSGLPASYVDAMFNGRLFMWDTAMISRFTVYARRAWYGMGGLDNFYAKQHDDGFICREIHPETGHDHFYPFDPNSTGPNIMAWAEWGYYRQTGDDVRLKQVFWPLLAYHRWCRANRTWPNGLYWATGMSSAMDNQPRVPDSNRHHRHWTWVDATMQASLNCEMLEQMANVLGEEKFAAELSQERTMLIERANAVLWNHDAQFYQDVDANGRFSQVKTIGAYWALVDKELVPEKRLQPFVQHLRDNWSFNLPHRIPSMSADSDGYNAETGNYCRGAVWPTATYMVLRGLRERNQYKLAHQIARNHLEMVTAVFKETGTFWENYAPETAVPGNPAKKDFIGAGGVTPISILLEHIIGIRADWPQRRIFWERLLDSEEPYGVKNLPFGPEGTVDLIGDVTKITVTTDTPFTLVMRDNEQNLQTAVPAGTTEIDLS